MEWNWTIITLSGISYTIVIMYLINMELILGNDVTTMVEELLNKKCGDIIAWWDPHLMSNVDLPFDM
jgi:hypothetical protein